MQRSEVLQWDKVIHKSTRTKTREPVGYIGTEEDSSIIVLASEFREYLIPKAR